MNFYFSRPVSIFIQLYIKFRCLHFASRLSNAKKINLANLKHKMNIFELVRLDILSLLESEHFPEWRLAIEEHVVESRRVIIVVTD